MDPSTFPPALGIAGAWGAAFFTVAVISITASLGYALGRRAQNSGRDSDSPVGSMVGATLGLLAFMLAFTFGMAASRHDARRRLVLEEANAIGTAHLRASLLPDASAVEVRRLLTDYVDGRLEVANDLDKLNDALVRNDEIQAQLWEIGRTAAISQPTAHGVALFLEALNEVFDLHTERLAVGARDRIPSAIWAALYLLTGLSMLVVGYHAGLLGSARLVPVVMLVLAFSSVVLLISDLDRPREGFLQVGQQPLVDLQLVLHAGSN